MSFYNLLCQPYCLTALVRSLPPTAPGAPAVIECVRALARRVESDGATCALHAVYQRILHKKLARICDFSCVEGLAFTACHLPSPQPTQDVMLRNLTSEPPVRRLRVIAKGKLATHICCVA